MYHFINDNFHTDIATVPPSYKMKHFHEHNRWELMFIYSCSCTLYVGDEIYMLNPGGLALIPPDMAHMTTYLAGSDHTRYVLYFNNDELKWIADDSSQDIESIFHKHEGRARRIRSRPDDRHPDREKRIRYHCSLPRKGCSGHQGQGQAALAASPQYPDGAAEKSSRCHKSVLRVSVDAHRETFNSMTLRCHAVLLRLAIPAAFPAHLCMNGLWLCRGEIQ